MTEEEAGLLAQARRNIAAARQLAGTGFPDIAASRLYYALLYTASALLVHDGLRYSSHRAVLSAFGRYFARTGRLEPRFHRLLLDTFRLRQDVDYTITVRITPQDVTDILEEAEEFLAAAKAVLDQ